MNVFLPDCLNCLDDSTLVNRWTMPLHKIGDKKYYLGTFFKVNLRYRNSIKQRSIPYNKFDLIQKKLKVIWKCVFKTKYTF